MSNNDFKRWSTDGRKLGTMELLFAEEAWKAATEACAAIKDAEIASRDLMIKELREAIDARKSADKYCAMYAHLTDAQEDCAEAQQQADELANEALANSEHHNSNMLDKMLLEVELEYMQRSYTPEQHYARVEAIKNRLAELNKE